MLTEHDQVRLRTAPGEITIPRAAVRDAILTRDYMRGEAIAAYIAALRLVGSIKRTC